MLRWVWACLGLLFLACSTAFSQDEDVPFVFAGGPLIQGLWLDLSEVEDALSVSFAGSVDVAGRPVFAALGGFGFAGQALRFGGMSVSAQWRSDRGTVVSLGFSYDALTLEAAVFRTAHTAVWWGAALGLGQWWFSRSGPPALSFEEALAAPRGSMLQRPLLVIQPYLGIEQAIGIVGVRLAAGVLGAWGLGGWQLPNGKNLTDDVLSVTWSPALSVMLVLGV